MKIEPLTLQEQYDIMIEHLQGMKEMSKEVYGTVCSYLTESGNRCAVGVLIPDGHEALKFQGSVDDLIEVYSELNIRIDEELGTCFQITHDEEDNWHTRGIKVKALRKLNKEIESQIEGKLKLKDI